MIASLPMYNQPDCLPALARYWALIRDGLRASGSAAPDSLLWTMPNLVDHWQRPDLVLSQSCGYPFRKTLKGKVALIGTPDFGVEGCAPGYYRSVLLARTDDSRAGLMAFRDAALAYNDAMSQSGWAAPQNYAQSLGFQFQNSVQTGGHGLSARAVLEGRADIAAIDAVTWRFLLRNDPALAALRVVDLTDPTPGLPYIAAPDADRAIVFDAISAAISALGPDDRETLGLKGIVHIPAETYFGVPNPPPPDQIAHQ